MSEEQNSVFLHELLETKTVNDTDILVIEDLENTKKITARNLRTAFIHDAEAPADNRIYSSEKVTSLVNEVTETMNTDISIIQNKVDKAIASAVNADQLQAAINALDNKKVDTTVFNTYAAELENKRDKNVPIKSSELSTGAEVDKIHLSNLGQDIISAMIGNTKIDVAGVPEGGWVTEDLADDCITVNKLVKDFAYRGLISTGNINTFVEEGLYLAGTNVTGLPKYDSSDNQTKLVEVHRYGEEGKYISQRVYTTTYANASIPWYERKGLFSALHTLKFIAHFDIMENTLITSNMLANDYANKGDISTGNVFDLPDGNYLCQSSVTNLPDKNIYIVDINTYGNRREYVAKRIMSTGILTYECYDYYDNVNTLMRTGWSKVTNTTKSKFDSKHIHLFGDSICYGAGATDVNKNTIEAHLTNDYGYDITNHALLDATAGNYDDDVLTDRSLITQVKTASGLSIADYAIIFIGSEDFRYGESIGADTSITDTSFKGSLNIAIKTLLTANPNIKILMVTPVFRGSIRPNDGLDSDNNSSNDKYLKDYANAVIDIAEYNHIPYLNLFTESMINNYTKSIYLNSNGIYLTDKGYELVSIKIHDAMCRFY